MSDQKKHQSPAKTVDDQVEEKDKKSSEIARLEKKIEELERDLEKAREKNQQSEQAVARAQADYQNLSRRTEEERQKIYQTVAKIFVAELLEPLEQLNMAAVQLNDPGLNMVLEKLAKVLEQHGLKPIEVVGQPFDVETMECVEVEDGIKPELGVVTKELRQGYRLGDEVIQHAKVIVGRKLNT